MTILKIFVSIVLLIVTASAQMFEKNEQKQSQQNSPLSVINQQSAVKPVVMDGPVDPNEYVVGPGDVFSINIWSAVPLSFQIPVTPEGSIIIPTVGELKISGLSLSAAKQLAVGEIRKKYLTGAASFTLSQPRSFIVTVRGAVLMEDAVIVQATQRVDAAITLANDVEAYRSKIPLTELNARASTIEKKLQNASRRNVLIYRKGAEPLRVDIEKYIATGNTQYNPLLRDGDVIVVPPNLSANNFVGVFGAVVKSGRFEFVEGDSLKSVLNFAGGITGNADVSEAIISRNDGTGKYSELSIPLKDILSGSAPDISLKNGDRIIVPVNSPTDRGGVVTVEGEVTAPGSYAILHDSTKLSEVIRKAGGFTPFAMLNGAMIIRVRPATETHTDHYFHFRKGLTTTEDTTYFSTEIRLNSEQQIVSADFVSLFQKNDPASDVTLQRGDRILIPLKTNSVYVFGEVKTPGFVKFVPGKELSYYLAAVDGITVQAEEDDIKIIKAGTKQWLSLEETTLEEGDYIWVPKEPYRTTGYYLEIYSQVFGIVGTIATLFLLVSR